MSPALRSFKLRFSDLHVRIVPATGADGCAFCGSGVDLTGAEAQAAFSLAGPLLAAVGGAGVVRTLSVDLERMRLLATCAPEPAGAAAPRGVRVVRIDDAQVLRALLAQVAPLLTLLAETAAAHLAARAPV